MRYIVNSREMKLYDKNTTEWHGMPSIVLMERAAVAFVEELNVQNVDCSRVLIVCGNGNNGGDGYAVARLLMLSGSKVDVVAADAENGNAGAKCSEANLHQQKIYQSYGKEILTEIPFDVEYTAVIDAVFGVGLSRNVEGAYAKIISQMNAKSGRKIALDIPSGISADNGSILGTAFRADITITFAFEKLGTLIWPGNEYSGEVIVREIGIDANSFGECKPKVTALEDEDLCCLPERKSHSNKGTYGRLLVIAGSDGMSGAAYLSAKAAYSCGCGLVRIITAEENRVILQTQLPEAIVTTYSSQNPDTALLAQNLKWADAIVCGPGIGTADSAKLLVKFVLENAAVPTLMDADALNIIAQNPDVLRQPHTELVVTPHLGEMSRLSDTAVSYIQEHLIEVAEEFARQYNIVCVLKDEHTVTAVPFGQTYLNLSGNAGMATAGSGDVLSGVIGSLLAQGMQAEKAAALGVYLHGRAGDVCKEKVGASGMMASDILEGIRGVMHRIEQ